MATPSQRLPPAFTSLYRLFLRTSSASVLHHRKATRNLRTLYRPTFDAGAQVTKQLQNATDAISREKLERWLKIWNQRVDNTLMLLYTSCKSRGLPHQLTRNLGYMVLSERQQLSQAKYKAWAPQLPPHSPEYEPGNAAEKLRKKAGKKQVHTDMGAKVWCAVSEVVKIAEGRDGISLGRVALKRRINRMYE
ncbi:hypothetical protein BDQ12DRAFT_673958 [Crucibulum laeve]|uniref:Uncharacterized protein n=1 Tax=Crucibulum laeve TaxID=68775 RepID=A0A5C3MM53_9AGAR|nr:hypothetical protein BDQ12DRAFT_673958 [Crucibulum laeve]